MFLFPGWRNVQQENEATKPPRENPGFRLRADIWRAAVVFRTPGWSWCCVCSDMRVAVLLRPGGPDEDSAETERPAGSRKQEATGRRPLAPVMTVPPAAAEWRRIVTITCCRVRASSGGRWSPIGLENGPSLTKWGRHVVSEDGGAYWCTLNVFMPPCFSCALNWQVVRLKRRWRPLQKRTWSVENMF